MTREQLFSGDGRSYEPQQIFEATGLSKELKVALWDIFSALTPTEVCPVVAQWTSALLDSDMVTITLLAGDRFWIVASEGFNTGPAVDIAIEEVEVPEDSLTMRVVRSGRPILWSQGEGAKRRIAWLTLRHYIAVPVFDDSRCVCGAVVAGFRDSEGLNDTNVMLAEIFAEAFYRAYCNSLNFSSSFLQGQVMEQERMAQELHDSIVQNVFAASMKLDELGANPSLDAEALHLVASLGELLAHIKEDLRSAIYGSPAIRREDSVADLIDLEIATHRRQGGTEVSTCLDFGEYASPQLLAVLRAVVRESLSNVRKHAQAQQVVITLFARNRTVYLTVQDDGKGCMGPQLMRSEQGFHFGISNLRRVVEQCGGDFNIGEADEGLGCAVRVQLPLDVGAKKL